MGKEGAALIISIMLLGVVCALSFTDTGQENFSFGIYNNTEYNGSAIILCPGNLSGTYTSKIFDAEVGSIWKDLAWQKKSYNPYNSSLTSVFHSRRNRSEVFNLDNIYYSADMRDLNKNLYLNFSATLLDNSVIKFYAKKSKGLTIGIYSQDDPSGSTALGNLSITSVSGEWYNITLNISSPTSNIWIGEGSKSEKNPKDDFDYIFAEVPGTNITLLARNCSQDNCSDSIWQEINFSNIQLSGRYFQYIIFFESPDKTITPYFQGIEFNYTIINFPPIIYIYSPEERIYEYNESLSLNFSVSDEDNNLDSCWYNLEGEENISLVNCQNITFNLSEGNHVLFLYANDSYGEEANNSVNFSVSIPVAIPITRDLSGGGGGSGGGSSGGGSSDGNLGNNFDESVINSSLEDLIISNLSFVNIPSVLVNPGESKELRLIARNTGENYLNLCKLKGTGAYNSWITSNELGNINSGQSYEFIFNLNIPESTSPGEYYPRIVVECEKSSESTEFVINVLDKKLEFDLVEARRIDKGNIKVKYIMKESSGINQEVKIQFLFYDSENQKITEYYDDKFIAAGSENEFESLIPINSDIEGSVSLLINFNSEIYSSFVQENVMIGSPISGFAIFSRASGRGITLSVVFAVIFLIFATILIIRIYNFRKRAGHIRGYRKRKKH
ncbi:MAG: hypothetical protein WC533_04665 [Candidatus Pacearchaeota archaeon]